MISKNISYSNPIVLASDVDSVLWHSFQYNVSSTFPKHCINVIIKLESQDDPPPPGQGKYYSVYWFKWSGWVLPCRSFRLLLSCNIWSLNFANKYINSNKSFENVISDTTTADNNIMTQARAALCHFKPKIDKNTHLKCCNYSTITIIINDHRNIPIRNKKLNNHGTLDHSPFRF